MSTKPSIDVSGSEKRRVCETTNQIQATPARPRPPWRRCSSVPMSRLEKQKATAVNQKRPGTNPELPDLCRTFRTLSQLRSTTSTPAKLKKQLFQISFSLETSAFYLTILVKLVQTQRRTGSIIVGRRLLLLHVAVAQQLGHAHRGDLLIKGPEDKWSPVKLWSNRDVTEMMHRKRFTHTLLYLLVTVRPSISSEMPSGETCGSDNISFLFHHQRIRTIQRENNQMINVMKSNESCDGNHDENEKNRWKKA